MALSLVPSLYFHRINPLQLWLGIRFLASPEEVALCQGLLSICWLFARQRISRWCMRQPEFSLKQCTVFEEKDTRTKAGKRKLTTNSAKHNKHANKRVIYDIRTWADWTSPHLYTVYIYIYTHLSKYVYIYVYIYMYIYIHTSVPIRWFHPLAPPPGRVQMPIGHPFWLVYTAILHKGMSHVNRQQQVLSLELSLSFC